MSSGAWEVVVDKAALEVSRYLSSTSDHFPIDAPLTRHMLSLLDVVTLRDVVVERNLNGFCGMIGCVAKPQSHCNPSTNARHRVREANGNFDNEDERERLMCTGDSASEDVDDDSVDHLFHRYETYCTRLARLSHRVIGAAHADRFCSAPCALALEELLPLVQRQMVYGRAEVVETISALFPNLRHEALQRLAGAESNVIADIHEKRSPPHASPEVEHMRGMREQDSLRHEEASVTVRRLLHDMDALSAVWAGGGPSPPHPLPTATANASRRAIGSQTASMSAPLLTYDWLLTITTPMTRACFARLWHRHAHSWGPTRNLFGVGVFVECMRPVTNALSASNPSALLRAAPRVDSPAVHPRQQTERLAQCAAHLFGAETTAALSRLLLFDHPTLLAAWSVWGTEGILDSLRFPFPLPGALFGGTAMTPAALFVAMVMAAATGLCVPNVWAEWVRVGNGLTEVLAALGAKTEDLVECVKVLTVKEDMEDV